MRFAPKRQGRRDGRGRFGRRAYLATGATVGIGGLVGCLGDDEVDPVDDGDDADDIPADDDDTTVVADDSDDTDPDADDTDDADDETEPIERHDVKPWYLRGPPVPADVQYASYGASNPSWYDNRNSFNVAGRSFKDFEVYGELAAGFDYTPGLLEITFRDDIVWWSGKVLDSYDAYVRWQLADWHGGGDDFDAEPNVITHDIVDDRTLRLALADTWREDWALQQTVATDGALYAGIPASAEWTEPWLEQFEDTGGDLDAVGDVREELSDVWVDDDDGLVHFFHLPFEFRVDGSIGDVGENYWDFELVPERNGVKRRWADEINFTEFRIGAFEESGIQTDEAFLDEITPFGGRHHTWLEDPPDFDWRAIGVEREFDEWGWTLNAEAHPTDNPHFRRAWTFATDRAQWEQPAYEPQEFSGHPYIVEGRVRQWVSADVIDQMTVYGINAEWDRAAEEMEIGGFERNGDGMWLNQETGEPIDLDVGTHSWMDHVFDLATDWYADLEDWGIQTEFFTERFTEEPWRIDAGYVGGLIPEFVFDSIFGENDLAWAASNPNFEESVMAPEMGDADADPDDWIEYDTRTMTDRLGVTVDDEAYQSMVDQLTWVANQLVPRTAVAPSVRTYAFNDNRWHTMNVEEAPPEKMMFIPPDRMWYNGLLSYVPEDER